MKKLLSIVASALALGAFADAGNTPMTFELPEGLPAGTAVSLVCDGEVVHTTTATTGSITYSTQNLAAGEYWLEYNGEPITESLTIGTSASAPQFASAKYAAPSTQMYVNALAGDAKIEAGTTAGSITVPEGGIAATHFDTTTAITGGSGTIANLFKHPNWGYITTHTISGWFKIDALPETGFSTIYGFKTNSSGGDTNAGYQAAVTSEGKITVGHIQSYTSWKEDANYTLHTTEDAVIEADNWYYMTVSIAQLNPSATNTRTRTAINVYVNGDSVLSVEEGFQSDLGGNSFVEFAIGGGMTAAGLYVDTTALDGTSANVLALATDSDIIDSASAKVLVWDNTKNDWEDSVQAYDGETLVNIGADDTIEFRNFEKVLYDKRSNKTAAKISVTAGDLKIGHDGFYNNGNGAKNLASGSVVTIAEGSKVILQAWDNSSQSEKTVNLDGSVTFNGGSVEIADWITTAMIGSINGTSPINLGNATIALREGATIANTISGAATIPAFAGMHLANDWTGTVVLGTVANWTNIGQYGNANSTVKFGGDFEGHLSQGCTITGDLDLGGHTIKFSNGFAGTNYVINRLVGEGTLNVTWGTKQPITITNVLADDGKTIAFTGTIVGNVTLTLPEGYELDAEGHIVKHVDAPTMPEAITGGSADQQTAYVAWAAGKNITDLTATGISEAFALNLTATELADKTFEEAVQDKLDTLLESIESDDLLTLMQAIVAGGDGVIDMSSVYPNATIQLVPASLGEGVTTDANLFRLSVEFKSANGQN